MADLRVYLLVIFCCLFFIIINGRSTVLLIAVVLCRIDHVWSSKECVCCACDPSVLLTVPSIGLFMFVYVGSYLLI